MPPAVSQPATSINSLREQTQSLLAALRALPDQREHRLIIGQNIGAADNAAEGYQRFIEKPSGRLAGRHPLLVGIDYGWDRIEAGHIAAANRVLIEHWKRGGMVTVCMHPGNPCSEGGTVQQVRGVDLEAVLTAGTEANRRWMRDLENIATGLDELRRAGVVVLWRPLHEMNGGWFWWCSDQHPGGWTDPAKFTALWRHLHRYLTVERKLDNLIWVYAPNAKLDEHTRPVATYYPGSDVVDVVGYDCYTDVIGAQVWNANNSYTDLIALEKPFMVSELGPGPKQRGTFDSQAAIASILANCPRTMCVMHWHSWSERRLLGKRYVAMALSDTPNAEAVMAAPVSRTLSDGRPGSP